jgi:hypothetical protein
MASRSPLLPLAAALLSIPGLGLAQTTLAAPPDVDQTLRARVNEFFQDFVDKKFRVAINLVAEDTQDQYFESPKMDIKGFKVNSISYSDNFTQALVKLTVTQVLKLKAEGFLDDTTVDGPMETTWKIENAQWVWYNRPKTSGWLTPMGLSNDVRAGLAEAQRPKINNDTMTEEAKRILNQTGSVTEVSPGEVTLPLDQPSSTKFTFHNGALGSVSISLVGDRLPGLVVKLDKQDVNAGEDATVDVHYDPPAERPATMPSISIGVEVQPFNADYSVHVNFGSPTPAK